MHPVEFAPAEEVIAMRSWGRYRNGAIAFVLLIGLTSVPGAQAQPTPEPIPTELPTVEPTPTDTAVPEASPEGGG